MKGYIFLYTLFLPLNCSLFTGNTQECQLLTIAVLSFAMLANLSSSKSVQRMDTLWFCLLTVLIASLFSRIHLFLQISLLPLQPLLLDPGNEALPALLCQHITLLFRMYQIYRKNEHIFSIKNVNKFKSDTNCFPYQDNTNNRNGK